MTHHRFTNNARPADGHLPADWATTTRPSFSWVQAIVITIGFWGALFLFALVTP